MSTPSIYEAQQRAAELRETWLERPSNYKPPSWAPAEAHAEHRARWERSAEYAHALQILRSAGATQPEHTHV